MEAGNHTAVGACHTVVAVGRRRAKLVVAFRTAEAGNHVVVVACHMAVVEGKPTAQLVVAPHKSRAVVFHSRQVAVLRTLQVVPGQSWKAAVRPL